MEINDTVSSTINGHIFSNGNITLTYNNTTPSTDLTIVSIPKSTNPAYPPVNVIDFAGTYPNLLQFSVLTFSGLDTITQQPTSHPIDINDGYWYGLSVTSTTPVSYTHLTLPTNREV